MFLSLLKSNATNKHKEFSKKLTPDTRYEILGVKVPVIKDIAKQACKDIDCAIEYLSQSHRYFEEWFLCGFIICYINADFDLKIKLLQNYLPNVDNWAICDSIAMAFPTPKDKKQKFFNIINTWLKSNHTYTVRFGITCLLHGYNNYHEIYPIVNSIKTGEYYVDMAIAWFYSVALIKDYERAIKFFEKPAFARFIHNKSIQKAIESFRISDEKKKYLKLLKI